MGAHAERPPWGARADVAPPDDYQNPCAKMILPDTCRRCISPEFKARACHEQAKNDGMVLRCQAWNYAMYCPGPPAPWAGPTAAPVSSAGTAVRPQTGRCSVGDRGLGGQWPPALGLAVLLACVAAQGRRRRVVNLP